MSSSTKLMENQLAEYENKARAVCIGVNHLALDTERIKQEELLQRVKELEDQLMDVNYTKTNLPKRASDIRSDVKSNSAALRYLETISQLERSFTVLTDNVSETSVQLSSPKSLPESVLLKKELGGNVQSCWNYVSQLSRLTQVHIRNAAEYHQDHLNHFLHLWGRSGQLLEDSRRVVPVHLRLGGIKNGVNVNTDSSKPVMARTLLSLAGPNYELEEGEEVRIISNSDDQHFWKVQTTSGVADVPSVCLWISDTDREAVKRAIGVRQKCTEGWELLVERMRERLRVFYTRLLNHMADKGDIAYTSKPMMRNFLNDLDHLYPPSDAAGAELKQAADRFTDRLVLVERGQKPNNETILREQDIVSMHSPLLRFRDHENQMDSLNVQSQFTGNDMANYLQEIDADRKRVNDEMAIMNSLQREHQAQLEHLIGRVRKWSSRYDKKFHLELGNQDSYLSPSPQSSVRSDHGWQSEPPIDEPTIMPTVRQTVAAGPRRSPSIIGEERSVVDAVTQIGVQTHNEGVQTLPTQIMSTDMLRQSPRNLKEAVCQIGQVTASTVSQTELSSTRSVPESRSKSYDAIVQVGQIVEDSSVHQLAAEQPTVHPMPVLVQRTSAAPLGNKNSDAIVQVGTILTDAYAQSDPVDEPIVAMQQQPIQQSVPRASVVDTTCHVARDTGSTSVQTQSMDIAPIKTKVNDAVCQIGRITTTASAQTDDYLLPEKKHITQQSTAVCEVGNVTADHQVQTEAEEPILPASSQQLLAQNTPSLVDTAIQIGTITKPKGVQTKPENRPTTQDSDFEWNKPPVQKTTGSHCVQTEAEPPGIDVQAQAGTISTFSEIQTDAEPEKPPGVDVQAQAGTISTFSETQTDAEPDKPRGLDVQAQAGTVSACSEIQTESPRAVDVSYRREIPNTGVSVELQTGIVHNHKEIQAQEEEKILVSPCVVNKQSEVPRRNDNIEVQVGTVSHTVTTQSDQVRSADVSMQMDTVKPHSNVELQTGVICNSKASQISEEVKPRSKSFDVLTQVGVSTQSQASQYSSEPVAKPRVYNAEIQSGVISQPKALQTTDLVTPTKEISLQAVSKPRASNVEAQCGSVSHVVGTQTTEAPVKSVRRYEVEAQAGYVYVSSWTQTKETKQPGRDLALATEQEVKPKGADVETQSGTIKKSVELQTTAEEKIPTPTEDLSVKAERKYADKELQIALQPTTSDVETQAGTCAKSDSVQTQLQTGVQDSRANYEKQVPDVPSINKKLQFTLRRKTEDAQTQHDVVAPKQITSVDDAMLIYQKSVPQNHAQIQTLRPDSGIDSCLEAEEEIKPEVLAPVKAEIPKRDVEAQSGVRTATAFAQTMEEPKPQKVQMNDAEVQMVYQTGYQDYAAQILPVYSAVESQTIAPKKQEVQDTRIACQTQNCDSTMQTDPEVKLTVPTRNTDTQADLKTVKYDVECQSGITVQTSTTQTKPQVVPKVVGKDAQIETMQADASIDSVLETEEPVKIQAVAPVKAAMPMDEAGIQAQILPPRSTVESQTIEPKKQEVQDIYIAHQTQNCDSTMQTHPEVKPAVIANNTATQANYRALGYDVECQSGITAQTSTTQTVPASQCMNIQLQSLAEPVTKTEAGIQTEMLPQMQDTRMTFKKEILDSNVQTDDEVKVPVTVPTLTAEHIVRSDDALVQTELKQPLSDLQCESSVCVQTSATQTKPQVVPKVVGKDAQIETMQADASIDSVLETEEPVKIQAVAPVKAAIPRDEAAIQAEIRPPYSNVESQSGICSKEEFAQTAEPAKPNVGDVRVAYQKSGLDVETQSGIICISDAVQSDVSRLSDASVLYENITPLVNKKLNVALTETTPQTLVNKKLQVALQSPGSDCAFQTEEEAAKELFNVETQAGILSKVASIQTTEEPKKVVPVEDASVLNEKAVLPAINKKLQVLLSPTVLDGACQTDALVRKPSVNVNKKLQVAIGPASQDETVQQDEIKSVDTVGLQAIVHPERFDAETQSGPVVTEKVKTDNRNVEFIAESPQPEVKVVENVQAAAPIPRKDREVQALILPERFDIECQSGTVQVVEANVKQEKPSEQLQNKKLQVALSQPTQDLQYQAVEATPAPASKSDRELQTNIVPQVSDVQLQTGVKSEEGSTQTINEAPPPKMKVQDTQAAFAKAVAPAEMQTEEEQVRVAPVMAAPPVQKHDRQIQAAIAPETFDVQLQSGVKSQEDSIQTMPELPPPKNRLEDLVVSSVLPTTTHGIQADILSSTYDAESQSAILGQEGSTQTKAEPPPLKAEVQDIQAVFAKIAAPVGMQTEEEAVKLAPVLAAVPVQKDDRQIQAVIVPQKADVQLQSGVTCQEGSTQTVAEPPPPPPKAEVHDVQLAFAKAVAPAGMQTEEEAVKLAPVLAAVPVQKDDRQIQAAIVPQKADVQLQSGVTCQEGSTQTVAEPPPPPKGEVRDVQAAFAVPHNSVQLQTTLSPEKHDAELQTGVTSRSKATEACFESLSLESEVQSNVVNKVCSAQTKAEPTLPPKTEVHDVQLAFAKAVAPAGMQTEEEAVKLAPVLAAVPVQKDDRQIQAVIVPQKADVQLQSGVTCQEGSTQTVAEPPPPPPKAEVHDVQLAFAKAVAPAGMQTEEEAVKLAPVLAAVPVQKDDRQIQAAIVPQKADVQLQSGVTCQEGSTQTVAEPPPPPKGEVRDVQAAFAVPHNSVQLQTTLSPEKHDAELQTGVTSRSKATEACFESLSLESEVQSNVVNKVCSAQTMAEPPLPKAEWQNVQAAYATPVVATGIQTEEVVNMEEITPTRAAPVISKDNREVQASVESVLGGAQTDAPQSVIRTDVSFTMPAAERSSKNKKLQVNMLTPVESVQVSTQSDTQAPKPSIYDSIVTTVTYSGMGQKPKHHDLLVESKPIVMDSYAQSAIAPTKRTSDVCTQTPKQEKESLIKSVVSFKEAPEKIVKSPEVVAYQKLEMPQKKEPLLLDGAVSFVPGQRNKKLQAILPTDEDTRSIMPEKAACEKKQMSSQTDLEAIEISKVARAIPKIKIDVECQSKVTQIGKKMQFSPSYHEQSNQTESQSFIQTTVYNADSPVVQPTATICASPPIIEQYTSHQQSKVQINKSDSCTQSLPAPLRTQMVTYTTKVLQTQTAVEPPPMVSNYSQSVQQAIKPELNEFVKTEPLKPKKDAAVGVEIAPADKSPYITSQVQLDVPTKETTMQTTDAGTEQHIQVPKRHVRIQKGSSWLDTRLVDDETQIDHDMTDFVVQPQQISNIQVSPPTDMVDANEAYVPPRYSTTVGARPASVTSPAGSLRGSSNGYYRPYRPEAVSWGIQCTPVTLTGVTQTNGYFKSEGETEGRIFTTRVSTTQKSDADVQCNIDTQGDDYFMKRVVTTVSRRGATSTYKRTGPVVRRILPRSRAHVLATSLPSHLDADFFDEDDEDIEGPVTTRKITTTEVEGGGRLVHEELITEEPRERGRSAGARLDFDILDAMEAKSEPNMDAEQCFRNLVNTWGRDYLFERLRHHGSTMSVDRDTAANVQRSSRLVGAKTQYTSCGNIAVAPTSLRNMETQTFISASTQRPPHKNKRIQRGPSCISWTPGQPGMGFSSPTGDEQGPLSQSNIATSYTETVRKQTTLETVPPTTEEYVCPKCGTSARLPLAASMQSQPLPITQLRNERSQTKSSGYFTLDNGGLTLPVYMSDKDVLRINPAQEIYEDPELSSVTWCPADEKSVESRGTSTSTKDEVWIDNPGKLLEVQVTGVTVPGTNKTITASEAFYRGLLRVVYWDYTKAGAREPSELSAAISLADAVLMNNVKLACKRIPASSGQSMDTVESGTSTLDANVVWTAPETHRTRYEVRAVRPEIEHVKEGTGKEYNLASAIEAGYIDRKSGLIVVKPSIFSKDRLPGDDKPEKVFVTDAINRGIVLADLIESDTSYQTPTDPRRTLPMYSPSQMQQDMDI
ncbi:unnamed protein product [Calicophoron daubneyi]|uniref:Desmoplakin SH3 domain-containing protein n=1 Tax=Calicophoron daubneyi TaxID=300641 RepID=A0AAV2TCV2_CALDB